MRAISIAFGLSALAARMFAQAPSSAINVGSRERVLVTSKAGGQMFAMSVHDTIATNVTPSKQSVSSTSPGRNPYIGAQFGYSLNGSSKPESNIIGAGTVMYSVIGSATDDTSHLRFYLPIRGNLAGLSSDSASRSKQLDKLLSSVQGIRVAAEPYLTFPPLGRYVHPVAFASAGWKVNSLKDKLDTSRVITAGRLSLGGELGLGPGDGGKLPVVVDLALVWTAFADGTYRKVLGDDFPASLRSGEFTVVMPIAANTGVLSEAVVGDRAKPVWRLGVILMAEGGK